MKQAASKQKTHQQKDRTGDRSASAGPDGMAMMPPAAGKEDQTQYSYSANLPVLQRAAINPSAVGVVPAIVQEVLRSPGEPLDAQTRADMEPRFGHDFSTVRVHTDAKAAESARAVNALAYTVGRDVVFGAGRYAPQTGSGQKLMAHELTHVLQQQAGMDLPVRISRPNERSEIEAVHNEHLTRAALRLNINSNNLSRIVMRQFDVAASASLEWRNVLHAANNDIQDHIRRAQALRRSVLQIEIIIEPNYVRVESSESSGDAPAGSQPDAFTVFQTAQQVLNNLGLAAPPSGRRINSVTLRRSGAQWDLQSQYRTGETISAENVTPREQRQTGDALIDLLAQADSARRTNVRVDLMVARDGLRIFSWRATGRQAPGHRSASHTSRSRSTTSAANLLGINMQTDNLRIYAVDFELQNGEWNMQRLQVLGEIRPAPEPQPDAAAGRPSSRLDEGELIVAEIRGTRQLVLTTAAQLIAEQDPTRWDNMIFSMGPFALGRVVNVARLARLGRLSRIVGRAGRSVFGEVRFTGLIQNRALRELSHQEIYQAFRSTPFTPSNHAIMRLKDARTSALGIETLNDVGRLMNRGVIQEAGEGLISLQHGRLQMIINPQTNILVTLSPL